MIGVLLSGPPTLLCTLFMAEHHRAMCPPVYKAKSTAAAQNFKVHVLGMTRKVGFMAIFPIRNYNQGSPMGCQ